MSATDQVLFLIAVLGILILVGIAYSFALPTPSHRFKAQSPYFARYFLVSIWLGYVSLCLPALNYPFTSAVMVMPCILLAMYMIFMTLLRRYGCALSQRHVMAIALHVIISTAGYIWLFVMENPFRLKDWLLSLSAAIPLILSWRLIVRQPDDTAGDKLNLSTVALTLLILVLGMPVYFIFVSDRTVTNPYIAFVIIFILTLFFMLGFVSSLMQTLFAKLLTQVYIDALTGTKNRHYLYKEAPDQLAHCRRHKQPFALVASDIDHFKHVNDNYGHPAGDEVLKQFARQLDNNLRAGDVLIRMGGEEFLALLPNCDLGQANALANRLCQAVRDAKMNVNGTVITLTASFGVSSVNKDECIFDGIRKADEALYNAKTAGRDQVKQVSS